MANECWWVLKTINIIHVGITWNRLQVTGTTNEIHDWVGTSTVPKNIKGFGYISSRCPFFCLAHAPSVCTKTSAARQWQIWSAKWCWFQLPTQWQDGYQIDALMTCTPWAHLFLQKADGSRCFAIWTAELPGWVTPSSAQQVSMPLALETLLLQI